MVDFLRQFSGEVTRVALATGTHGVLGQQANVDGVKGEWRNLTDSVNTMSLRITDQVRSIAEATVRTYFVHCVRLDLRNSAEFMSCGPCRLPSLEVTCRRK